MYKYNNIDYDTLEEAKANIVNPVPSYKCIPLGENDEFLFDQASTTEVCSGRCYFQNTHYAQKEDDGVVALQNYLTFFREATAQHVYKTTYTEIALEEGKILPKLKTTNPIVEQVYTDFKQLLTVEIVYTSYWEQV